MSQSFVKIMLSHDPKETGYNLIPISSGDVVGFVARPYPHIVLNGAVHCEVNGPVYVMNGEGKTISNFNTKAPEASVISVRDVTAAMLASEISVVDGTIRGVINIDALISDGFPEPVLDAAKEYANAKDFNPTVIVERPGEDWLMVCVGDFWLGAVMKPTVSAILMDKLGKIERIMKLNRIFSIKDITEAFNKSAFHWLPVATIRGQVAGTPLLKDDVEKLCRDTLREEIPMLQELLCPNRAYTLGTTTGDLVIKRGNDYDDWVYAIHHNAKEFK